MRRGISPHPKSPGGTDCSRYTAEELSAYASGLLTPQEAEPVERHLHACDVCLREVTAIHRTLHLLKCDTMLAPPARLVAAVRQALNGADQQPGTDLPKEKLC
jgi:anti-sigma factor RsiW